MKRASKDLGYLKKGQVWYTDFIIAILIFVIALVIFYTYDMNLSSRERAIMDELLVDAKNIAQSLVSEGNPPDWNDTSVIRVGITDGNMRINQTKLDMFHGMDYDLANSRFGTRFNWDVSFDNSTGHRITITGGDHIGRPLIGTRNVGQVTRLLIYNSTIVTMKVQVWN